MPSTKYLISLFAVALLLPLAASLPQDDEDSNDSSSVIKCYKCDADNCTETLDEEDTDGYDEVECAQDVTQCYRFTYQNEDQTKKVFTIYIHC